MDEWLLDLFAQEFRERDIHIQGARSIIAGIEALRQYSFDAVVLDMLFKGEEAGGREIWNGLRNGVLRGPSGSDLRELPVIFATAFVGPPSPLFEEDAHTYIIHKPFDPPTIVELVANILGE